MDATGHAALSHVLHDATSSVVEQLRAQLQEKERKICELDRQLARATYIRARQGAKLRRLRRPRINPQATD